MQCVHRLDYARNLSPTHKPAGAIAVGVLELCAAVFLAIGFSGEVLGHLRNTALPMTGIAMMLGAHGVVLCCRLRRRMIATLRILSFVLAVGYVLIILAAAFEVRKANQAIAAGVNFSGPAWDRLFAVVRIVFASVGGIVSFVGTRSALKRAN